jgi:hypothetical protein
VRAMLTFGDRQLGTASSCVEAAGLTTGGWNVAISRVTGEAHTSKGKPCDDFWTVGSFGPLSCVVVADGASSAAYAQFGAQHIALLLSESIATERYAQLFQEADTAVLSQTVKTLLEEDIARARSAIPQNFDCQDDGMLASRAMLRDFAATLIGVLLCEDRAIVFSIGDSAGFVLDPWNMFAEPRLFAGPDNGQFANETYFFTSDDWQRRLRVDGVDGADAVVLMTDGVTSFGLSPGYAGPESRFWGPVLNFMGRESYLKTAEQVLRHLQSPIVADISSDDKTVVVLLRRGTTGETS